MGDLESLKTIDSESWANIPPPVKNSISSIATCLASLTGELRSIRRELKSEIELTNSRTRKLKKDIEDTTVTVDDVRKHARDEIARLEKAHSSSIQFVKDELSTAITEKKATTFREITERSETFDDRLRDLRSELQTSIEHLRAEMMERINSRLEGTKSECVSAIAENASQMSLKFEEIARMQDKFTQIWTDSEKKLKKWVETQTNEARLQREEVSHRLASIAAEIPAVKTYLERKIATESEEIRAKIVETSQKSTEIQRNVHENAQKQLSELSTAVESIASIHSSLQAQHSSFESSLGQTSSQLRTEIQSLQSEFQYANCSLLGLIAENKSQLSAEIVNAGEALEQKRTKEIEAIVELRTRELRAKLDVGDI